MYGYTWVVSETSTESQSDACGQYNLQTTPKEFDFQWDQLHCDAISAALGMNCSLGDFNNSAQAMW